MRLGLNVSLFSAVLAVLAGSGLGGEPASPALPTPEAARSDPERALRLAGAHFSSADPDLQLRARRLGRLAAIAFLQARTPKGMVLVPPSAWAFTGATMKPTGGFYLGRTEVTRAEFGLEQPAAQASHPATEVSLDQARRFAAARGCRLPTRDELWQAATAGGVRRYPWGDRFDPSRVHARESAASGPTAVDAHPGGAASCGALGLLGNVAEWTETVVGRRNKRYLAVGGSFRTFTRKRRFETARLSPEAKAADVGFRLARSLPALPGPAKPRAPSEPSGPADDSH